ncbi:hypothetical protein K431DRAFT_100753 [Polychaeton citri CBS 116435]|uniref:Uncharacterized protein n=1 Tax=Polychaeton citri CBS 116435 TaxID=1314669 RepID=A0A9P4QI57_9PEZI|nr:hypothetical protein K431DRAFT_100753 [Polychaeton citri CBS 116435]
MRYEWLLLMLRNMKTPARMEWCCSLRRDWVLLEFVKSSGTIVLACIDVSTTTCCWAQRFLSVRDQAAVAPVIIPLVSSPGSVPVCGFAPLRTLDEKSAGDCREELPRNFAQKMREAGRPCQVNIALMPCLILSHPWALSWS